VAIEFVTPTWDEQTSGNWGGKWDISIASMTPTAKRAKNLDFPACYYYGMAMLAVHKDNSAITVPDDASGKRIGVLSASIWQHYLKREPFGIAGMPPVNYRIIDPNIVEYDSEAATYDALAAGNGAEIDGLIDSLPSLLAVIKEGRPFKTVGIPLFRTPQCVAIEPGDAELSALVEQTVSGMRNDGTLSSLSIKWFEFDMTKP